MTKRTTKTLTNRNFPDIRQNVASNFRDFGLYKTVLNINDIDNLKDNAIGDAVDDLSDIVIDLLEIKWRIENKSLADGLWYFQLVFYGHTQQHILDLLNYMKKKTGSVDFQKSALFYDTQYRGPWFYHFHTFFNRH